MKNKVLFKKADILILCLLLAVASIFFLFSKNGGTATAEINIDGKTVHQFRLSQIYNTCTVNLDNGMEIEISHNSIRVISSDCSGKDCINCGELTSPGDIAVCIPNKTVIKLTGDADKPDALVY